MYVRAGRPAFARPCVGIHKSTSLMSSSLGKTKCTNQWHFIFLANQLIYFWEEIANLNSFHQSKNTNSEKKKKLRLNWMVSEKNRKKKKIVFLGSLG